MKIAAFSSRDWDDNFITKRRREGVSDATICNSAKLLDQMFKQAVKNGRLTVAPKITIPTPPKAREVYLSKEHRWHQLPPDARAAAARLVSAGQRRTIRRQIA